MAPPIMGSGIPGSSWRSHQFKTVTTTTNQQFNVDGYHEVYRISFQDADGALTNVTVTITVGQQVIFSAVPVPLLATPAGLSGAAFATGAVAVWEPLLPIPFSANWPIIIVPSTTLEVALQGREVNPS